MIADISSLRCYASSAVWPLPRRALPSWYSKWKFRAFFAFFRCGSRAVLTSSRDLKRRDSIKYRALMTDRGTVLLFRATPGRSVRWDVDYLCPVSEEHPHLNTDRKTRKKKAPMLSRHGNEVIFVNNHLEMRKNPPLFAFFWSKQPPPSHSSLL